MVGLGVDFGIVLILLADAQAFTPATLECIELALALATHPFTLASLSRKADSAVVCSQIHRISGWRVSCCGVA